MKSSNGHEQKLLRMMMKMMMKMVMMMMGWAGASAKSRCAGMEPQGNDDDGNGDDGDDDDGDCDGDDDSEMMMVRKMVKL